MKTNKNFLKKLTAGVLGFVMTLGVGAAGYAGASNETRALDGYTDLTPKADFTTKSVGCSSYDNSTTVYGDWTIKNGANNNKQWTYFKMGGKSSVISSANPCYIYSTIAASDKIDKIQVSIAAGSLAKSGMSVNSWGVYIYSNSTLTTQVDYVAGGTITKNANVFDFVPSAGKTWPKGSYVKVNWDLANTSTTNGIVCVDKITLYKSAVVHTVGDIKGSASLYKGQKVQYTTSCNQSDAITWTIDSANPAGCAEIVSSNYLKAKAAGSVTVKATCAGGGYSTKNITISDNVFSMSPVMGQSGETAILTPSFNNWTPTGNTYSYTSSDSSIASVDSSGVVTFGSTTGTATITCTTTVNDVTFTATAEATTAKAGKSATLSADKDTYYTDDTYKVTAAFSGIEQKDTKIVVTHNSVNTDLTYDTSGSFVTGTFDEAGDYRFVVVDTTDNNAEISDPLNINVKASSITSIVIKNADESEEVSELSFTLPTDAEKTVTLKAVVSGEGNYSKDVTWSSSNSAKVSVTQEGVVSPRGKASGVIITATAVDGKTDTVTVNVSKTGAVVSLDLTTQTYKSASVDSVVWETNDFTFKSERKTSGSGTAANNYIPPDRSTTRIYNSLKVSIVSKLAVITQIEFVCASESYANKLVGLNWSNGTASINPNNSKSVIVVPTDGLGMIYETYPDGASGEVGLTALNVTFEAAPDITGITLTGDKKTTYATNEKFDATNIGVSISYDEGNPKTDSYASSASKFAFYKSNSFVDANKLTPGTTSVNGLSKIYVVYDGKTDFAMSYDITVASHNVTIANTETSVLAKAELQMAVSHDAGSLTDDAITWSVKAADGISATTAASITTSGKLTGGTVTSNTTVTVIATCKYGGTASKSIVVQPHTITLSGSTTAVINRAYSFTCTHNGSDAVSYKVVDPDNNESSPESTSFTPTSIGTYKITASCSCCLESNELDVVVGYAAIENVVVKHNGEIASSISTLINTTVRNLSVVAFDENDETNTVSQQFTWSIDYEHSTDITASDVTFDSTEPSVTSSKAGTLVLVATSNQDNSKKASISITFNSVSADITYPEGALDVYYGEQAKILTAASIGFTNPVYNWSTEWTGEGNCPIGITEVPGTAMAALSYNSVTPSEGVVVKLVVTESSDPTVSAAATKTVIVRSSGVDSLKIKKDNVDVTNTTVEIWDNGDAATFTYDITSHGIVSETAVWSLSSGADSLVSTSQSGGAITITSKNKIAADSTFTLTATNTSTYGDPAETTASVTVKVKKSSVTVTLPTNLPEIYNGENGSVAVTVSSAGNITDGQKTVTYSKSTANSSEINSAFSIEQSGLSCSISVLEAYPISSSEGFYITVTNNYDNSSQDIYVKVLHSRIEDFDIDSTTAQKTIYASEDTKNTVNLSASMTTYGCATNEVDWSIPDGETAISLNKTQSASGEEITITANPNYDFGSYDSHTVCLTATSHYDTSKTDTISIVVKREYVNKLEWTGGSNIDDFEGLTLSTGWGFKATYNSTKSENPTLGDGDNNVHVYIVDDANITDEPTDLTPISSTQKLSANDNGKYLVAFYKGVKCSSPFSITATERLNKITAINEIKDSGTKTTNDITTKIFDKDGTKTIGDLDLTLSNNGDYYGSDPTKGQQVGSGSKPAKSMTLSTNVSGTITEVKINTSGAKDVSASVSVSVGGTAFKYNGNESVSITANASDYTFIGSGSGNIIITWTQTSSKALYFKNVTVKYNNTHTEEKDIENTDLTAQKAVVDYAKWFNVNAETSSWDQIQNKYAEKVTNVLTDSTKLDLACKMFKFATHSGNDLDVLQQCVEKYDQLRYKDSTLNDFLDRGTQAVQFTVTLDKANGDPIEHIKVNAGGTYTLPEAPKNGSYDFQYWDVGGVHKNPNDTITISDNVTVTAAYSEQIKMSTDIAFQFTGLEMKKGQVKFEVEFDGSKDGIKEYGFLVTTNTAIDPTSLDDSAVLGTTPTGYNKVVGKNKAVVASTNLALDLKVVFYYIDENGIHFSEVVTTSFEDIARDYDSTTITDKYAKACFDVYQASLKDNADKGE